jgi:hypothetical protein
MSLPIEALEAKETPEFEVQITVRSLEGTKGYNYISPESKEIKMAMIMNKNPEKWEYLLQPE